MIKAIGLWCALAVSTAYAQPVLAPTPSPPDTPHEKAGTSCCRTAATRDRGRWASSRAIATPRWKMFHEGNVQLNDGLFAKAAELYGNALKRWDHPAIHYNLALAQMNLNDPLDAFDNMTAAIIWRRAAPVEGQVRQRAALRRAAQQRDRRGRGHLQQDRREGLGRRQGSVHRTGHLQREGPRGQAHVCCTRRSS